MTLRLLRFTYTVEIVVLVLIILLIMHTQAMLQQYGPSVPEEILRKLVSSFSELREMADEGLIAYPYSTREVVSIVRHLQVL